MTGDIGRILQIVTRLDENARSMNDQMFKIANDVRSFGLCAHAER